MTDHDPDWDGDWDGDWDEGGYVDHDDHDDHDAVRLIERREQYRAIVLAAEWFVGLHVGDGVVVMTARWAGVFATQIYVPSLGVLPLWMPHDSEDAARFGHARIVEITTAYVAANPPPKDDTP